VYEHYHWKCMEIIKPMTYPSNANNRNHIKFNKGCIYGGPPFTSGCPFVYVTKTTWAVSLFCRHKNLKNEEKIYIAKVKESHDGYNLL
jgi:hypothetical protein